MKQKIDISHRTIIFTFVFTLSLWLLYQVKLVLLLLFLAFMLASILKPLVVKLEKLHIPRQLGIILIYLLLIIVLGISLTLIIPDLVDQTSSLAVQISNIVNSLPSLEQLNLDFGDLSFLGSEVIKLPQQVFRLITNTAGKIVYLSTVLIMAYFMLLERKHLDEHLEKLFAKSDRKAMIERIIKDIECILGSWARGQLVLMLIVGLMSYLGLLMVGFPSILPLAILAGLLEFVPNIGPVLATVPAAVIGFSISPLMGVTAIILFWLIQQIENNFLVPKIMQSVVGINPLAAMSLLLGGYKLAGVAGTVLAVPIFLCLQIIVKEIYLSKNGK